MAFVNIPGQSWREPVSTAAALPTAGNAAGDTRVTIDTTDIYIWTGSAWQVVAGDGSATWGMITGTLSAQTDLQSALNAKQNTGNYITALTGDVTATGPGSVAAAVASVGGSTAANVNSATVLANAATSANTANAIVRRDSSGNFLAGTPSVGGLNFTTDGVGSIGATATTNRPNTLFVKSGIGLNLTATQVASAIMQIDSTTQGVLVPRMTTAQRDAIASPANGLKIFNTTTGIPEFFSTAAGSKWLGSTGTYINTSANLTGTYFGNVMVNGTATLTANTVILGDLIVATNLVNTGGFSLDVYGDLVVRSSFNFTPASTASAQGGVYIRGDCTFNTDSGTNDFRCNPGRSPYFAVNGVLIMTTLDGSGIAAGASGSSGPGLFVQVAGGLVGNLHCYGGDATVNTNAGSAQGIFMYGPCWGSRLYAYGGASTFAGRSAGNAGAVQFFAGVMCNEVKAYGGAATGTATTGGNGSTMLCEGDAVIRDILDISGGSSAASTGGNAGSLIVYGSLDVGIGGGTTPGLIGVYGNGGSSGSGAGKNAAFIQTRGDFRSSSRPQMLGGSGTTTGGDGGRLLITGQLSLLGDESNFSAGAGGVTNGSPSRIDVTQGFVSSADGGLLMKDGAGAGAAPTATCGVFMGGHTVITSIDLPNRAGAQISLRKETAASLKIGSLVTKKTLNNFAGTASTDVSADTESSMFSYFNGSWYKHAGTTVM